MTFDGAPLNKPEDSTLYFADFGGFAGALESVQIQRGVGTSTVGTASYGGSVNFASVGPADAAAGPAELGVGSFGTLRGSADLHSGRLPGGAWRSTAARSIRTPTATATHSDVRQRSALLRRRASGRALALQGSPASPGREDSQLAFLASERAVLERDPRDNPLDPARARPLRPGLGAGPVHALPGRLGQPRAAGLLQRRWRLVSDLGRPGGAQQPARVPARLALVGALLTLRLRARARALHGRAARERFREPARADAPRGRPRLREPRPQVRGERFRQARLRRRPLAPLRRRAAAPGALPLRGRRGPGQRALDVLQPQAGCALRDHAAARAPTLRSAGRRASRRARTCSPARTTRHSPYDLAAVQPESVVDVEAGLELRNARRLQLQVDATRWSSATRSRRPASCRRSGCRCAATSRAAIGAGWSWTPGGALPEGCACAPAPT